MPELPEVETTRCGIAPWIEGRQVARLIVRQRKLRQPVPRRIDRMLPGCAIAGVRRRAKYLLLDTDKGTAIIHLGMSGSLRVVKHAEPPGYHDHFDMVLNDGNALRFRDPRRFGLLLWTTSDADRHPLIRHLGPEPLGGDFDGDYLYERARGRRLAVKNFIMDGRIVVGVGNIYASEALHGAGIRPSRPAGRISLARMERLAGQIRDVLQAAIAEGGTTLRDFAHSDGSPGYFRQQLAVYDREGHDCLRCATPIRRVVLGQRSTYFCPACQR